MVIQPSGGLSKSEIDKMIKNAEQFRQQDQKKRETIETKNTLDSKIHSVEKIMNENKDKLSQEIVDQVTGSLQEAKEAMGTDDADKIKSALEKLEKDSLNMGNHMYQRGSQQQQQSQGEQQEHTQGEENKEKKE